MWKESELDCIHFLRWNIRRSWNELNCSTHLRRCRIASFLHSCEVSGLGSQSLGSRRLNQTEPFPLTVCDTDYYTSFPMYGVCALFLVWALFTVFMNSLMSFWTPCFQCTCIVELNSHLSNPGDNLGIRIKLTSAGIHSTECILDVILRHFLGTPHPHQKTYWTWTWGCFYKCCPRFQIWI